MLKTRFGLVAAVAVAMCGCNMGTPGGPGVQKQPSGNTYEVGKPVVNNSSNSFSLSLPVMATSVKQGESATAKIGISRGSEFKDSVTLGFSSLPAGVSIEPSIITVKEQDQTTAVTITASNAATVGEHKIKVTGHSDKGGPNAENELKLTVTAK